LRKILNMHFAGHRDCSYLRNFDGTLTDNMTSKNQPAFRLND
jgi:hypothetical protein